MNQNEEIKASGIAPAEETELEHALEDIIERFQEADTNYRKELEDKKTKNEGDTRKAVEMRKRSLETFFGINEWERRFEKETQEYRE